MRKESRGAAYWLLWMVVGGLLVAAGHRAVGQVATATILGGVKDTSGAVIPEATVTATNQETGISRNTKSASNGSYRFVALPVGNYEVRVEQVGFQTKVQSGLRITVGEEAVLNFTLEVGAVTETVSATAEAPIVNTTSGSLSGLVSEQTVSDLPLDGRNYGELTLLQTGVTEVRTVSTSGNLNGTQFSSNGAPFRSNNWMIDGTIMNDSNNSGPASANETTLGVEGIREFRVITNSFSAEYGTAMGSQIMLVSKSGTNQLHGSLFEYLRNVAVDARNWTDGSKKPGFRRNNFGAAWGGPIRPDKAFFFVTYEGLRQGRGSTLKGTVPTLAARQDGGLVPKIAESVKPYLALFPAPNGPNLGQGIAEYSEASTLVQREDYGQARVDHTFSDSDTLFGRFTIDDSSEIRPGLFAPQQTDILGRNQWATLSDNHIFTPMLLNTFRASFSRTHSPRQTIGREAPGLNFVPGLPMGGLGISGISDLGGGGGGLEANQRIFSVSNDMFYTRGNHSMKFGTLINWYRQFFLTTTFLTGSWSFSNLAAFLEARPNSFTVMTPGSRYTRTYDFETLGFYIQDDLRVTANLMLNLGLRYEISTQSEEIRGNGAALRDVQRDAQVTPGIPFIDPTKRNIGPRFGFAWDVRGDGQTALRGGFGLLYDIGAFGSAYVVGTSGTPPLSSISTVSGPALVFGPLPTIPPEAAGRGLRTLDYHMQQPHLLSYNLTLERQLPLDMGLTLAYAGSRGINIMQTKEGNPTVPQGWVEGRTCVTRTEPAPFVTVGPKCWTGRDPRTNPYWDTMEYKTTGGSSRYNALQVGLLKRLSRNLQFQSSYTWSHMLDDGQGVLAAVDGPGNAPGGDDPSNRRHDYSSSVYDLRHNWRFNAIYRLASNFGGGWGKLANGWWISSILTWSSGFPFDPTLGTQRSRSKAGGANGSQKRADLVPGVSAADVTRGVSRGCLGIPAGTRLGTPQLFYDPCALAIPPLGFLGNAGRGLLSGPNFSTLNFSLVKDTPLPMLGESGSLQFRTEIFNILNHPALAVPALPVFAARADVEAPLPTAGRITSTLSKSRELQFALKILF